MLHVTERAKEYLLQRKLAVRLDNRHVGMRLASISPGKLALIADSPRPGDQIVMHKESTVLLIDAELSGSILAGRTVDCKRAGDGRLEVVVTNAAAPATEAG